MDIHGPSPQHKAQLLKRTAFYEVSATQLKILKNICVTPDLKAEPFPPQKNPAKPTKTPWSFADFFCFANRALKKVHVSNLRPDGVLIGQASFPPATSLLDLDTATVWWWRGRVHSYLQLLSMMRVEPLAVLADSNQFGIKDELRICNEIRIIQSDFHHTWKWQGQTCDLCCHDSDMMMAFDIIKFTLQRCLFLHSSSISVGLLSKSEGFKSSHQFHPSSKVDHHKTPLVPSYHSKIHGGNPKSCEVSGLPWKNLVPSWTVGSRCLDDFGHR